MKNIFNLKAMHKKGEASAKLIVGVVVALLLIGVLAPTAIVPLFNATAFSGVPAWVPTILGTMGVIALIFALLKLVD